ncbi:MAG: hypothetical protein HYW77_02535 [Parcubacteria group bacterium]|nr:hypothetical protein [Parcubacteria group bacterium]
MSDSPNNPVQELSTPKKSIKLLIKESYIEVIKKSVGANLFQNLYAEVDGEKTDILQNGRRSCAVFVSRILFMFKLIHDLHASVYEVVRDLESSDWEKAGKPEPGDVLVYETKKFQEEGDEERNHAAFYIGSDEAVSTYYKVSQPIKHHYTYGTKDGEPVRKVVAIYRYDFDANHEKVLARKLS